MKRAFNDSNWLFNNAADWYYLDSEFTETNQSDEFRLEFISVGFVTYDGQKYYGVYEGFDPARCDKPWVEREVIAKLPPREEWVSLETMRQNILKLIRPAEEIEIWTRNGSYDNFVICRIFKGWDDFAATLKHEKGIQRISFRDTNELRRRLAWPKTIELPDALRHIADKDADHDRKDFLGMRGRILAM